MKIKKPQVKSLLEISTDRVAKKYAKRKEDLTRLRIPHTVNVKIDLVYGLAYLSLHDVPLNGVETLDASGVHIDVSKGNKKLIGLEDISKDMQATVDRWVDALLKAVK